MTFKNDLKILLADDDKINQRLATITFGQLGLKCDIAANGFEALEMHMSFKYDFIFMDMQMPVLGGIEATKKIREYERKKGLKETAYIVALTASELSEKKEECFRAGMNEFLEKPLQKKILLGIIEQSLKTT
jgi:two-component system, sensor histidine kinase